MLRNVACRASPSRLGPYRCGALLPTWSDGGVALGIDVSRRNVGRGLTFYELRLEEHWGRRPISIYQVHEHLGAACADFIYRLGDGGQTGADEPADLDVIEAGDRIVV